MVLASFAIAWYVARGWTLEWLVERDIEINFGNDEFLGIVVGLWSACIVALAIWMSFRLRGAKNGRNLGAGATASG